MAKIVFRSFSSEQSHIQRVCSLAILMVSLQLLLAPASLAAVGCSLSYPERDVKRIFPESTDYRTKYKSIKAAGGEELRQRLEKALGRKLDKKREYDVLNAIYLVFKEKNKIGMVLCSTEKGEYGGIQIVISLDESQKIRKFYIQKEREVAGKFLRSQDFCNQFMGLSLEDFDSEKVNIVPPKGAEISTEAITSGVYKLLIMHRAYDVLFSNAEKK